MRIIDYHVHSNNSFDGINDILSICKKSIERGITEICFTEHFSVDPTDVSYNILNYKKYHSEIEFCKNIFKDNLIIKEGLEIGEPHLEHLKYMLNTAIKQMNLDFIIGSVHNIDTKKLRLYIKGKNKKVIYEDYFNEIYNLIMNSDIDVIGHFDLMKRYAYNDFGNYDFKVYEDIIRNILKQTIKRNIGIEINTSGLLSNIKDFFPSREIIKIYKELGGKIITIGSDAHNKDIIGNGYLLAVDMLKAYGFDYIFQFEKRKPKGISIK